MQIQSEIIYPQSIMPPKASCVFVVVCIMFFVGSYVSYCTKFSQFSRRYYLSMVYGFQSVQSKILYKIIKYPIFDFYIPFN